MWAVITLCQQVLLVILISSHSPDSSADHVHYFLMTHALCFLKKLL